jgi:phosphate transport system permease protein
MNNIASDGDADLRPGTHSSGESRSDPVEDGNGLRPEPYDAATPDTQAPPDAGLKPERYGDTADETLHPGAYEADGASAQLQSSVPAGNEKSSGGPGAVAAEPDGSSGGVAGHHDTQSVSLETSSDGSAVKLRQLIAPNDTIDGVPHYVWQPVSAVPKYSFMPLFLGALKVTLIGLAVAAPLAILAALFTTAFAPRWMREIMKPAIEILAGFPSVVIGFFCLMILASVVQSVAGTTFRLNAFVGGLGMALAVIPIIYTVTEDALSAVPRYMKEASLALGSSRWQTTFRVVLPAAIPGVFAAVILGFGRAFGETMIALMATGNAALVSSDIFESVRTMSATIGAEMAEVEFHSVHYGLLFLIGAVLFVVTFSLNALAEFVIRKRLMKRFQGL